MDLAVVTLTKLHFSEGGQLNREMRKRVQTRGTATHPQQETMLDGRDVKCLKQGRYFPGTRGESILHRPPRTYLESTGRRLFTVVKLSIVIAAVFK